MTALTMLEKLSSVSMMSDASFATSVPAMPYTVECLNVQKIQLSLTNRLVLLPFGE